MHVAYRVDIGTLNPPRELPDGRIVFDGLLTRTGVFQYVNPDGSVRREFRPPSEVFDADSLASFALTSVTNDHPSEMVTPDNASAVTVGMVGENIRKLDNHVAAPLVIFDAATIADIKAGKVELSCGYNAEVFDEAGVTEDGEHYDSIQKNIRGNHVAIVDVARAGPDARLRLDSAVMTRTPTRTDEINKMELAEALKTIAKLEVGKAAAEARADMAESGLKESKADNDKLTAERDVEKERADKAEKARTDADDGMGDRVKGRVKLVTDAHLIIEDKDDEGAARFDGMTDREVKVVVIKTVQGFECTDAHNDAYVDVRHELAVEQSDKSDKALEDVRSRTELTREDAGDEDKEDAARKRMLAAHKDAHKGKGTE